MVLRIAVLGDSETEVRQALPGVLALGFRPDGPVTDRLGVGGWMARARQICAIHRYDHHGLPEPWLCGKDAGHEDPGPACGDWIADGSRCDACGRTHSEHLRDLMRFHAQCQAWPPEPADSDPPLPEAGRQLLLEHPA